MDLPLINLIIDRVFPLGAKLVPDAKKLAPEFRFWLINSKKGTRWIVPQNPNYGISILQQWRPYGTLSYWKWQLLLTAYRSKTLQYLPGVTSVGIVSDEDWNWRHLGYEEVHLFPVTYIGTPGPNRKAVVSLIESHKFQSVGIAKVPLSDNATAKILQEAEILASLANSKPGLAPQLLHLDPDKGIAVQTVKEGKLTQPNLTSAHISWFTRAEIPDLQTSLQEQVQPLKEQLNVLDRIDPEMQGILNSVLTKIEDPTPLQSTWVHGDFTPWNLKLSSDRQLEAVDWEEAKYNGLPLQDLFHFQYIQSHLLEEKKDLLEATRNQSIVADYLEAIGIDLARYKQLAQFYLAESWLRCQEREDWDYADFLAAEISQLVEP